MKQKKTISILILKWFFRILVTLFVLIPLYGGLILALTPFSEIMKPMLYPAYFNIQNFIIVWKEYGFGRMMLNSLIYSITTSVCVIIIALPAAYTFARFRFLLRKGLMFFLLLVQMLSEIIILPALFKLFIRMHLLNTSFSVIFIMIGVNLSLAIWILVGYVSNVPVEIDEAAYIDGASVIKVLTRVIFPIVFPGIAVSVMVVFINCYNNFLIPLFMLNKMQKYPITLGLYGLIGEVEIQWQLVAAGSLIGLIPVMFFFLLCQRFLIPGLTAGAIK